MSKQEVKTTVGADGLRYRAKAAGSPFAATGAFGAATMSCFLCGKHRPRAQLKTRKLLGRAQSVCAPSCKEADGQPADAKALAAEFNWPAVMAGFKAAGSLTYAAAHAELLKTPDGTPGKANPLFPGGEAPKIDAAVAPANKAPADEEDAGDGANAAAEQAHVMSEAHPVGCIDCHDPQSMQVRVTLLNTLLR